MGVECFNRSSPIRSCKIGEMNHTPVTYESSLYASSPAPSRRMPSGWAKLWAAFGFGVLAWAVMVAVDITGLLLGRNLGFDTNAVMAVAELCGGVRS